MPARWTVYIYNYIYVYLYSISLSSIHVSLYLMLNLMKTFIGFWHHINRSGMVPSKVSAGSPNKYHLESRWLATSIRPGWSWPLTNRHLLGVAIAIYFHHSVIHLFITAVVISTEILSLQIAPRWKIGWGTSPFKSSAFPTSLFSSISLLQLASTYRFTKNDAEKRFKQSKSPLKWRW